ncbi:universal stress protein [Spirosoma sp. SC4-14]|uniref:universal stress protein n=1 Tax=Spirosoma sp. SC4-14 TaxID=3128900 RepID=UPI0030D00BF2
MKTIILATDFSHNANLVARFAAQLARTWKAELVLLNTYHFWPDNPAKTGNFPLSAEAMGDDSRKELKHLAHALSEDGYSDVPIRYIAKEGHTKEAITAVAKAEQASLLIMSTVGSAPQSAQLMGSTATDMVTETTVPLLLVPPAIKYASVKNLVLGINLETPPNAIALDTALRFAHDFQSVVNILCINDNPSDPTVQHRAEHIRRMMTDVPHTITIVAGREIYDTMLTFAHDNKADLLIMFPQEHYWFEQLFAEGETQRMARLTDIPLLAVV